MVINLLGWSIYNNYVEVILSCTFPLALLSLFATLLSTLFAYFASTSLYIYMKNVKPRFPHFSASSTTPQVITIPKRHRNKGRKKKIAFPLVIWVPRKRVKKNKEKIYNEFKEVWRRWRRSKHSFAGLFVILFSYVKLCIFYCNID